MASVTLLDLNCVCKRHHDGGSDSIGDGSITATDRTVVARFESSRSHQLAVVALPDPSGGGQVAGVSASDSHGATGPASEDAIPARDFLVISTNENATPASSSPSTPPCDVYEIQALPPFGGEASGGKYASFFIGSRLISNPWLHVGTRIDPLFFALFHFHRASSSSASSSLSEKDGLDQKNKINHKWQPWDQFVGDVPAPILRALNVDPNVAPVNCLATSIGQLGHLMEVSDMCGDDLILCRFSEDRALRWLRSKFDRTVTALRTRIEARNATKAKERLRKGEDAWTTNGGSGSARSGAFCSSFHPGQEEGDGEEEEQQQQGEDKSRIENTGTDDKENGIKMQSSDLPKLSKEEESSLRKAGLQLICEYLPAEWRHKFAAKLGMSEADWTGRKKSVPSDDLATSPPPGAVAANDENGLTRVSSALADRKRPRSSCGENPGQADADALLHYAMGGSDASVITPGQKGREEVKKAQSVGLKRLAKVNTKGMKSMSNFFGKKKK